MEFPRVNAATVTEFRLIHRRYVNCTSEYWLTLDSSPCEQGRGNLAFHSIGHSFMSKARTPLLSASHLACTASLGASAFSFVMLMVNFRKSHLVGRDGLISI